MRSVHARAASMLLLAVWAASDVHAGDPEEDLPTITVTAARQAQDLQAATMAVTVLDAATIRDDRIETSDDVARHAANVHFLGGSLYIRGIGSSGPQGFDPSVGVFVDGLYLGRATAALAPFLDLRQIEVVRGPQGTLLGKNTIGGALLFVSAEPGDQPYRRFSLARGSREESVLEAVLAQPLGDDYAMRVALLDSTRGSEIRNTTLHRDESDRQLRGGRVRLAWQPAGSWSGWLSVERGRNERDGFGAQLIAATPAALTLYRLYDPATEADRGDGRNAIDTTPTYQRRHGEVGSYSLVHERGTRRFTLLGSAATADFDAAGDVDFGPAPILMQAFSERYRQWSQELRIEGEAAGFDYLAGVYVLDAALDVDGVITAFPAGVDGLITTVLPAPLDTLALGGQLTRDQSRKRFRQDAQTGAVFAQIRVPLAPDWALTGGLRATHERKTVDARNDFASGGLLFRAALGESAYIAQRQRRERELAPRMVLQYEPDADTMLYLGLARGHKGGGFNELAANAEALEYAGERSTSLEAGYRRRLGEQRGDLGITVFGTDYDALQVAAFDGSRIVIQNAAAARIQGAELETRLRLGARSSLTASLGFLDARYRSFPNAPAPADSSARMQDLRGEPLARAPRWSGAVGIEQGFALADGRLRITARAHTNCRSRSFLSVDLDPLDAQPAYCQIDAGLRFIPVQPGWSLRILGQNLGDEQILTTASDVPLFAGTHWGRIDARRRVLVQLDAEW